MCVIQIKNYIHSGLFGKSFAFLAFSWEVRGDETKCLSINRRKITNNSRLCLTSKQGHEKTPFVNHKLCLLLESVLEALPHPVLASALPHATIPPRGCPGPNTPTYRQANSKTDETLATKRRRKRRVHACNNLDLGLTSIETNEHIWVGK